MLQYSTVLKPLFFIGMGMIYALAIAGARVWAQDLGLAMTWWKWLLVATWYIILNLSFAAGFTLIGEKEPKAGYLFLGVFPPLVIVLGIGCWFLVAGF